MQDLRVKLGTINGGPELPRSLVNNECESTYVTARVVDDSILNQPTVWHVFPHAAENHTLITLWEQWHSPEL